MPPDAPAGREGRPYNLPLALQRLGILVRPNAVTKARAEALLRERDDLPRPCIFSNEDGAVEMEWHDGYRSVILTIPETGEMTGRWDEDRPDLTEDEGEFAGSPWRWVEWCFGRAALAAVRGTR